jgi:hypothetical protein|tara:strand:+ start:827 stop:2749 length:1923 start_codon:yes stop_codon:yes gene_type:complete
MADYSSMTDEQLAEIVALGRGGARGDDLDTDGSFLQDIGGYLKRHGEVPGAIGGAITGAAAGSMVGPIGTIVGGLAGGALGSAGGSLASDAAAGEDLDFGEAGKEAAISVAFDIATLGAGKVLKPVAHALGMSGNGLNGLFRTAKKSNIEDEIVDVSKINAGTKESLRITQKFLEEKGSTLTAAQLGQVNFLRTIGEGIGDIGVVSGRMAAGRIEKNNDIIHAAIKDLSEGGLDIGTDQTFKGAGEVLYGAVTAGRTAARSLMDDGIKSLTKKHGMKKVSTMPVVKALRKFKAANVRNITDDVSKGTLSKTDELIDRLIQQSGKIVSAKQADLGTLIAFEKSIQRDINKAMPSVSNSFSDPQAVAELTQLKKAIQGGITESLNKINPEAGSTYRALNSAYSETMTDLMPDSLGSVFAKASMDEFDALGKLMISGTDQSKIGKMMKSLDKAYAVAKKAKIDMSDYPAKTADDARKFIRQGYVKQVFSTVNDATDLSKFAGKAAMLGSTEAMTRAKAVLGPDFNNYKKLVNAISDTSTGASSNMFGLAIRQKEVGTLTGMAQVGGAGAAGVGTAGLGAVGILLAPVIMSKLATNKRAVNMLLGLDAKVTRGAIDPDNIPAAVGKILESLDDHDKEDIRKASR